MSCLIRRGSVMISMSFRHCDQYAGCVNQLNLRGQYPRAVGKQRAQVLELVADIIFFAGQLPAALNGPQYTGQVRDSLCVISCWR